MHQQKKKSVARSLGKGLAYVQDTLDVIVGWGFKKLKTTRFREDDDEDRLDASKAQRAKHAANKVLRFFGDFGDSFYTEYEIMKQKRKNKEEQEKKRRKK